MFACSATNDLFRSRIDHMIDLRHPLAVLAAHMRRAGVAMPDLDLFGEQVQRADVPGNAGCRRASC